jgi:hypothetical protein
MPPRSSLFSMPLVLAALIIPLNFGLFWIVFSANRSEPHDELVPVFLLLCVTQLILGVVAIVGGARDHARAKEQGAPRGGAVGRIILSVLVTLGAPLGAFLGFVGFFAGAMGGAWGRPLRIKGRQLHPELREGADWAAGGTPDARALDLPTRRALEALWLHDAQKEHASVPAFSRISWLLAAIGAPAELTSWAHRAALEEIDHAQRCFALAAGYGGRTFTVEPMPDLLLGGLGDVRDPLVTLAVESLKDGCLLEDFNADVAARCAAVCEEPVTRDVLERIAREERSHAEFSWALLDHLLATGGARVEQALRHALSELEQVQRPTNATPEKARLIALADAAQLRRHGRLEDGEWAAAWDARLVATRARVGELLARREAAAA